MINLLPPQEKKEFLEEKRWRLVLILGILTLLFLIVLFSVLFSIKVYISGEVQNQKILMDLEEEKFQDSQVKNLEKEIKSINQNLFKLATFYQNQPNFTELLVKISKTLPSQTYFTNLNLKPAPNEKNKFEASLSGFSPAREFVSEFRENLKSAEEFYEVYFPLANWAEPNDVDFSVIFKFDL